MGGYLDGPGGLRVKIERQEFPYDIGIWKNLKQGMGSANVIAWFWPLARTLPVESGLAFEGNGFSDVSLSWPPPDPDRIPMPVRRYDERSAFLYEEGEPSAQLKAFQERQQEDMKRWQAGPGVVRKRRVFADRFDEHATLIHSDEGESFSDDGEEGWKNSEGERLADFGVDEEAEFYDEDEIPLAELIERKRQR